MDEKDTRARRSIGSTSMSFSETLRQDALPLWNEVIHHKFTKELASNTIDRQLLKRYLIQDHRFLDSFVVMLASIIAHAQSLSDRIPACQFLALITSKENNYFERSFDQLKCTREERDSIPDASCTADFCHLMKEVSFSGSLGQMLAVIVVCEWSYLSWGQIVEKETVREDFLTFEWVDLHSGAGFQAVVEYLRKLLDEEAERMSEEEKEKCKQRFLQAVQLEKDFFDYVYEYL